MQTKRTVEQIQADIKNVIAYSVQPSRFIPSLQQELNQATEAREIALAIRCALKIRKDFPELDLD